MAQRLVVIGNGMAGARTVEEILERGGGELFAITMLGEEPYGNYNRILLSNVLSGVEDEAGIFLNSLSWYADNGIELRAGVRAPRIDRFARRVYAGKRDVYTYDKLIIATGSRPFVPAIKGMHSPARGFHQGVFTFRTIDDTRAMIRYARHHERAVVIGGGLLGLEAARGLQAHGVQVTLVHSAGHLMNQQLAPPAGAILKRSVQQLGIAVELSARTTEVTGEDSVAGVRLADGRTIPCDMVVVAAGIRPNTELASLSGLPVERGIVVDDQMRLLDEPDIYAVGECAQHRGELYGLVAPLWEQAKVLADHITGANPAAAYHGSRIATKLKVAGVDVAAMGVTAPEREDDEVVTVAEPSRGMYKNVVIRDDRVIGATLIGDLGKIGYLMQAYDGRLPLPQERIRLLFDLGGPSAEVSAAELDDTAQVCNCNGVTKACHRRGGAGWREIGDRGHGRDPGRQGLWLVPGAGHPDRGMGRWRHGRRRPRRELVRAGDSDGQAGPDGGDTRARPALRVGRFRGACRRGQGGCQEQDGPGVAASDDVARRVRGRAGRPLHQRQGARQHPEGRHVLRRAPDEGGLHHPAAAAPHRRCGGEILGAAGQAHRRAAH